MRKIFLLVLGFVFMFAGIASAGGWVTSVSNISFTPSKNVSIYWNVDTNNQSYALGSKHTQGNRIFATTSASSKVYYKESNDYIGKTGSATGVTMPGPGSTVSGWSSI